VGSAQVLRDIRDTLDKQNELLEELVTHLCQNQRQRNQELAQWKAANPALVRSCRRAAETLSRVQTDFLKQMTREVNEKGYFKCIKHCIIQFRFETVDDVSLRHFGHQNVIDGISLSFVPAIDGSRRIAVEVESLSEMELSLSCRRAVVADLTPGLPAEGVYTAS